MMRMMRRLAPVIGLILMLAMAIMPTATPANAALERICFPETGQCMEGTIRNFWDANGGLPIFGYPIGPLEEAVNESGELVTRQRFERNSLELHPENDGTPYNVLLGRLGVDRLNQLGLDWFTFPKGNPADPYYRSETGHSIAEVFWLVWSSRGLEFDGNPNQTSEAEVIALWGLPLSEPYMFTNCSGDTVMIQWFERARFEWHPNNPLDYQVQLGLLGNELIRC